MPLRIPDTEGRVRITVDTREVAGLMKSTRAEQEKYMNNLGKEISLGMASIIAEKAVNLLSTKDIKASGQASENIFVREAGKNAAELYEGDKTAANRMLRRGRRQDQPVSDAPPVGEIVDWLIQKQIPLKPPPKGKEFTTLTKKGGVGANLTSMPKRPFKVELRQVGSVVARHIAKEGMTSLKKKPPGGTNRFDYITEARRLASPQLRRFAETYRRELIRAHIEFIELGNSSPRIIEKDRVSGRFEVI